MRALQRDFGRTYENYPPTVKSIRQQYEKSADTGCISKGKSSDQPNMNAYSTSRPVGLSAKSKEVKMSGWPRVERTTNKCVKTPYSLAVHTANTAALHKIIG